MAGKKFIFKKENIWNQEFLKMCFRYHPDGYFIRKCYMGGPTKIGQKIKGCLGSSKYKTVRICGQCLLLHRVIFYYHKGWLPEFLDHKNRNRLDNRIENLRPATKHLNSLNRSPSSHRKNETVGVTFHGCKRVWRARITINGKSIYIGSSKNKNVVIKKAKIFRKNSIDRAVIETILRKKKITKQI